jgi:hypothetical protein
LNNCGAVSIATPATISAASTAAFSHTSFASTPPAAPLCSQDTQDTGGGFNTAGGTLNNCDAGSIATPATTSAAPTAAFGHTSFASAFGYTPFSFASAPATSLAEFAAPTTVISFTFCHYEEMKQFVLFKVPVSKLKNQPIRGVVPRKCAVDVDRPSVGPSKLLRGRREGYEGKLGRKEVYRMRGILCVRMYVCMYVCGGEGVERVNACCKHRLPLTFVVTACVFNVWVLYILPGHVIKFVHVEQRF